MTWNDLAPIYRVLALSALLLFAINILALAIGLLWLIARRSLWARVSL